MEMSEFRTIGDGSTSSVGDLEWSQVAAMLSTMGVDEHLDLIKLEIRKKGGGLFRVIVKAKQK